MTGQSGIILSKTLSGLRSMKTHISSGALRALISFQSHAQREKSDFDVFRPSVQAKTIEKSNARSARAARADLGTQNPIFGSWGPKPPFPVLGPVPKVWEWSHSIRLEIQCYSDVFVRPELRCGIIWIPDQFLGVLWPALWGNFFRRTHPQRTMCVFLKDSVILIGS